jgi:hypothetical protein
VRQAGRAGPAGVGVRAVDDPVVDKPAWQCNIILVHSRGNTFTAFLPIASVDPHIEAPGSRRVSAVHRVNVVLPAI